MDTPMGQSDVGHFLIEAFLSDGTGQYPIDNYE